MMVTVSLSGDLKRNFPVQTQSTCLDLQYWGQIKEGGEVVTAVYSLLLGNLQAYPLG